MKNDIVIYTEEFRISSVRFLRTMFSEFGGKWWLSLFAMLICPTFLAAVFADLRWLVIAAMIALLLIPMVSALLYFNYGLRRECYCNIPPHYLKISKEGISTVINISRISDDNEEDDEPKKNYREIFFPKKDFGSCLAISNSMRLRIRPHRGFIIIPYEIFRSREDLEKAIDLIFN